MGYEELIRLPNSNGYQNWTWTEATKYVVPKGEYIMQLQAAVGGFNLKDIKVEFLKFVWTAKIINVINFFNHMDACKRR